jgi:hypothetical protein
MMKPTTCLLPIACLLGASPLAGQANHDAHHGHRMPDSSYHAMQARGKTAMGVDQYTSFHVFDALPDGGRIELQRPAADSGEVATIRAHLADIANRFGVGDFSIPGFVHDGEVPGTKVMAARKDRIEYAFSPLPKGGEVRIKTSDPKALAAIRKFMAFQRKEHHSSGRAR